MKKYRLLISGSAAMLIFALSGCFFTAETEITARHAVSQLKLTGKMDDPGWYKTPVYVLEHGKDQFRDVPAEVGKLFRGGVIEPGKARVLWDEKYLYFGFEFTDRDMVSESTGDQDRQDLKGDAVSVFLKPLNKTWYWEIQVTPDGRSSVFFYPGRGVCQLPGCRPAKPAVAGVKVMASGKGSLNNSWDNDKKWTAEIALPRAEIGRAGEPLDPDVPWLVSFRRVNYGRELPMAEISAFPGAAADDFHYFEKYGRLKMVK